MKYIEALQEYNGEEKSLFLAGPITHAPDWQSSLVDLLKDTDLALLNPRRKNFPMNDLAAAEAQVKWEHKHLRKASAISFWFSRETSAPITLYELGAWSMTDKPIFIGIERGYLRRADVEVQTRLARPDVKIVYDFEALADLIKEYAKK